MYISPVCCIYICRYAFLLFLLWIIFIYTKIIIYVKRIYVYICKTYQKMNDHVLKKVLLFTYQIHEQYELTDIKLS